jgi:glycosyltransferase 2 family protein
MPVRLERVRPRTVITLVATVLAAYFLLGQLGSVNLGHVAATADWAWGAVALGFSVLCFVGATMSLQAFAPQRLPFWGTFVAQVASSFVTLIAPSAVGNVTLNVRYLQRRGMDGALAVTTVGLAQIASFVGHLSLLLVFGLLTGRASGGALIPAHGAVIAIAAVAAIAAFVLAVPQTRHLARRRLAPTLGRILPRLLDVLQQPRRLSLGLGGALVLTLGYISALYAAVEAFGGGLSYSSVAVVFLAGSAIGSAAPTPGGLGAIEAAIAAGLTAAGLGGEAAVSATLLFRIATFWLRVPPGWVAFTVMQRKQQI